MIYIKFLLHTDYSGPVLTNPVVEKEFKQSTIAYLDPYTELIHINEIPICHKDSEVANMYFCRDDDNQGQLRHKYTYAIAYSKRQRIHRDGTVSRLTEEETDIVVSRWKHFIKDVPDAILFNSNFFNATIEDLQKLAQEINIRIKLDDTNNKLLTTNNNQEVKVVNNVLIKK